MPQLEVSTYLPQIFWLSVLFSIMFGFFIGVFLPKLNSIFKKRIGVVEKTDEKITILKNTNNELQQLYNDQKNDFLKDTQAQMDAAIDSIRKDHEKRLQILENEFQCELDNMRNVHIQESDSFADSYRDIINEAVELTLKKLSSQEMVKNGR